MKNNYRGLFYHAKNLIKKAKISLNIEETILLQRLYDLVFKKHFNKYTQEVSSLHVAIFRRYEHIVDELIIIGSFELYAKGVLLLRGYIPHKIIKPDDLRDRQSNEPIHVRTLRSAYKKGQEIKIDDRTIEFNKLVKRKYWHVLKIPQKHYKQIVHMNKTRNMIHFAENGIIIQLEQEYFETIKFLIDEINRAHNKY